MAAVDFGICPGRVGPSGRLPDGPSFSARREVAAGRALEPLAPRGLLARPCHRIVSAPKRLDAAARAQHGWPISYTRRQKQDAAIGTVAWRQAAANRPATAAASSARPSFVKHSASPCSAQPFSGWRRRSSR